jgi:hypothetical protein
MGPVSYSETSVQNYNSTLRNVLEERRSCRMLVVCSVEIRLQHLQFKHPKIVRPAHSVFMRVFKVSNRTAIISLYSVKRLVFVTEVASVYCAVRAGSLSKTNYILSLKSSLEISSATFRLLRIRLSGRRYKPLFCSEFLNP